MCWHGSCRIIYPADGIFPGGIVHGFEERDIGILGADLQWNTFLQINESPFKTCPAFLTSLHWVDFSSHPAGRETAMMRFHKWTNLLWARKEQLEADDLCLMLHISDALYFSLLRKASFSFFSLQWEAMNQNINGKRRTMSSITASIKAELRPSLLFSAVVNAPLLYWKCFSQCAPEAAASSIKSVSFPGWRTCSIIYFFPPLPYSLWPTPLYLLDFSFFNYRGSASRGTYYSLLFSGIHKDSLWFLLPAIICLYYTEKHNDNVTGSKLRYVIKT